MSKKILVSVTTAFNVDWKEQIKLIKQSSEREIALFLTALNFDDRQICYSLLQEIDNLKIPFIHAKNDMKEEEYRLLIDNFGAEYFNHHSATNFAWDPGTWLFKDKILIENAGVMLDADEVKNFAGLCLDLTHHENDKRLRPDFYENNEKVIRQFPVLANHLGPILDEPVKPENSGDPYLHYDSHMFHHLVEFDYLKNYPANYFGKYLALELMNPLQEQIKAKKYLETIIDLN